MYIMKTWKLQQSSGSSKLGAYPDDAIRTVGAMILFIASMMMKPAVTNNIASDKAIEI
jgi:hypothetical protein